VGADVRADAEHSRQTSLHLPATHLDRGDVPGAGLYVAEKYEKRGRLFLVFEAIFKDESGKEVLRDRRTQLVLTEDVTIKT